MKRKRSEILIAAGTMVVVGVRDAGILNFELAGDVYLFTQSEI
jgi:hypothetical protein